MLTDITCEASPFNKKRLHMHKYQEKQSLQKKPDIIRVRRIGCAAPGGFMRAGVRSDE